MATGHTATHWIRLAWPRRQSRRLRHFLSGSGNCRCRPVVYVQELGMFDATGHSTVKVSVMTPAKRSRAQPDISDSPDELEFSNLRAESSGSRRTTNEAIQTAPIARGTMAGADKMTQRRTKLTVLGKSPPPPEPMVSDRGSICCIAGMQQLGCKIDARRTRSSWVAFSSLRANGSIRCKGFQLVENRELPWTSLSGIHPQSEKACSGCAKNCNGGLSRRARLHEW
jgi:hypothetical protein